MVEERLSPWEALFARALAILNSAAVEGANVSPWSFGGATALMLKLGHRVSKDIEIFVPDPESLGALSPRLNAAAEALTASYVEHPTFINLYFPEGEIDFVVSPSLGPDPVTVMRILGREVSVETPAEIIAKRIWYRAASFNARDVFDLACVAEREPAALLRIPHILAARRTVLLQRLEQREDALREDFDALDVLEFRPEFDDCLAVIAQVLAQVTLRAPHRAEQTLARYDVPHRLMHASA